MFVCCLDFICCQDVIVTSHEISSLRAYVWCWNYNENSVFLFLFVSVFAFNLSANEYLGARIVYQYLKIVDAYFQLNMSIDYGYVYVFINLDQSFTGACCKARVNNYHKPAILFIHLPRNKLLNRMELYQSYMIL